MTSRVLKLLSMALLLSVVPTSAQPAPAVPPVSTAIPSSVQARLSADLSALLAGGPRVAGTPVLERAGNYLAGQYQAAGYQTRVETFSYSKTFDDGSSLTVGGRTLEGTALNGSSAGDFSAALAPVDGVGTPEEFASAQVRGRIAVVRRGTLPFRQKVENAVQAGARAVIIVNNASGALRGGTLGFEASLPVLGLSREDGEALLSGTNQSATLLVRAGRRTVTGRNLVAYRSGVTAPQLIVGGHYDSVQGAPGANDNASGTVTVLELARRAANTPLAQNAWFVAFDGEEDGLHGSKALVSSHPEVVRGLKAMLNFDMVGVDVTPLSVGGTPALVDLARGLVPELRGMNDGSSGSDHAPFISAGAPALFFFRGLDANYHQPGDRVADPALLEQTVEVGLKVANRVLEGGR